MLYTLNFADRPVVSSTHILILFILCCLLIHQERSYCLKILSPPIILLSDETDGDFHFSLVSRTTVSVYIITLCVIWNIKLGRQKKDKCFYFLYFKKMEV